jgi:hypothetical protein
VAYITLEESQQGEIGHNFWKEVGLEVVDKYFILIRYSS